MMKEMVNNSFDNRLFSFKNNRFYLFLIIVIGYFSNVSGQIETKLNPETILIGDTASLQIIITTDANTKTELPEVKDSLNQYIEINDVKTNSQKVGNNLNIFRNYTLTGFESGTYLVNSLPIVIDGDTLQSKAMQLEILDIEVDSLSNKIFPIKNILPEHLTWWDRNQKYLWYFIMGFVLLVAIIIIVYMFIKEQRKKKYTSKPLLPPYEEALRNLKKIDKDKYLSRKKYYEYYSELSYILRRYFARRFEFPAMALLSDDLPQQMLNKEYLNKEEANELKAFLKDADLVKFAKTLPKEEKHELYRKWVEKIIKRTRPIIETVPEHIKQQPIRKIDNVE